MNIAESISMGLNALMANKLRSFLTILGIVFGVGSVIAMLAIGDGAQKEIMDQLTLTGVNNIVIRNKPPEVDEDGKTQGVSFSNGLSLSDVKNIQKIVPNIKALAPEIESEMEAIYNLNYGKVKLVGTNEHYADMFNFRLISGNFIQPHHDESMSAVAVIGEDVRKKLFKTENPIGKKLKVGDVWLEVIGVVAPKSVNVKKENENDLGVRNYTMDVYIPASTFLIRFLNKGISTGNSTNISQRGNMRIMSSSGGSEASYQLDKITIQVTDTKFLKPVKELLDKILTRLHYQSKDFEIIIPQELLDQQQKTKQIFNIVLGCIGGISLLVGGIGIMNIMLATVTERTKEIGVRRAIGATKQDVIVQFVIEALVLCVVGGLAGIIFGVGISFIISIYANINTIISIPSIIISFTVACIVGLIFGLYPARKAAEKDPVESLRYE